MSGLGKEETAAETLDYYYFTKTKPRLEHMHEEIDILQPVTRSANFQPYGRGWPQIIWDAQHGAVPS
jgi:hypothetical protein